MKLSSSDSFKINEYVFSKLKGYPWWPGQIIEIDKIGKKYIYKCADSYTKTISKVTDNKNIAKFEDNVEYVLKNQKGKKLIVAVSSTIENMFEGKKIPKKYKKILDEIKEGNFNTSFEKKGSMEIEEKEKEPGKEKEKEKETKNKGRKGENKKKEDESNTNVDENIINLDESKEKETKKLLRNKGDKSNKNEIEENSNMDMSEKIGF